MTWGETTDTDGAAAQLSAFVDAGGTLVETADGYGDGAAQEVLAKVLATSVPREYVVLAAARDAARRTARRRCRPRFAAHRAGRHPAPPRHRPPGPVAAARLRRHRPAGGDALRRPGGGDVRRASATGAWWRRSGGSSPPSPSAAARWAASPCRCRRRWSTRCWRGTRRSSCCPRPAHHGVGLLAWAPLGRGVLTGKYADGTPADSRAASPALAPYVEARRNERSARIVQAVLTAADGLGTLPAGGGARLGARPARVSPSADRRRPRRRSAHRLDGDRERSRCPPRSAPRSTT